MTLVAGEMDYIKDVPAAAAAAKGRGSAPQLHVANHLSPNGPRKKDNFALGPHHDTCHVGMPFLIQFI